MSDAGGRGTEQNFAAYPRAAARGTPEQLEAIADGYFLLVGSFWISALILALEFVLVALTDPGIVGVMGFYAFSVVTISWLAMKGCKRIDEGLSKPSSDAVASAILLGISMPLFVGLFQYATILQKANSEILEYGVRKRFLCVIRRSDVNEVLAQMRGKPDEWQK